MNEKSQEAGELFRELRERAKELNCLYAVEELCSDPQLPFTRILEGVVRAIPAGWQYPQVCRARINCRGEMVAGEGFRESPWMQRAVVRVHGEDVGFVEVAYLEERPRADEGPFLREERRLIQTIADRIGACLLQRWLTDSMSAWRNAHEQLAQRGPREWTVILNLLRRTDHSLLMRVARKMINHLCWSGVKEADTLLRRFGLRTTGEQEELLVDTNQPHAEVAPADEAGLADEVFDVASRHLSDEEIVAQVHRWIRQDRASFLLNTLEKHNATLAEVGDAILRHQYAAEGEIELTRPTLLGLRVALVRRFLTDQLEFINVAKNYVDIKDFHELLQRMIYPAQGHGRIGGKSSGLFLAAQILKHHRRGGGSELLGPIRVPRTWYVTSDALHDFIYCNHLEDVFTQKYKDINEVRREYPDIIQVFKHSHFSSDMIKGLSMALDDFGERPVIVRSSSLLEDRFGAAFSGKYKSLFLANQGSKRQRLRALLDAIAEVYASTFGPDPIQYRAERNLLDFQEGMGLMIQEVVGNRVGDHFLPAYAGVAFSLNEFRWSPRIRREDGLVRLVAGMGTRAVDRLGDDYPVLVSPGQPGLRANTSTEEIVRYAPRRLDAINLRTNTFETVEIADFLRHHGAEYPAIERLVSVYAHGDLRAPFVGQVRFEEDELVVTFEGLLNRTPFLKQLRALLELLQKEIGAAVDIEFASDGRDLYLLQCRTQGRGRDAAAAPIPRDIPPERVLFSARRYVSNGIVENLTHIVYVDPQGYGELGTLEALNLVGRAVGRLNKVLPKRQFILMGPGRWGSRGDIRLGVRVTYADICNTAMLVEIARRKGDYVPDLSFGTHFFQDLVESSIRYLPLYPDEPGIAFNEAFFTRTPNILAGIAPEFASLADVVRVIDVPSATGGSVLRVLMNADLEEAVGILARPEATLEAGDEVSVDRQASKGQHWRWRLHMAEQLAAQLDAERYGIMGMYVFGSTKNATAGPASDINLLVHFRGTPAQREQLAAWLEGWSEALAEINYQRTGYRREGLLDVHIITDEDLATGANFAAKINAPTDAARPLVRGGPGPAGGDAPSGA
jgi:predicted nucleotidyltransferase